MRYRLLNVESHDQFSECAILLPLQRAAASLLDWLADLRVADRKDSMDYGWRMDMVFLERRHSPAVEKLLVEALAEGTSIERNCEDAGRS